MTLARLLAATALDRALVREADVTLTARLVEASLAEAPGEGWHAYAITSFSAAGARVRHGTGLTAEEAAAATRLAIDRINWLSAALPEPTRLDSVPAGSSIHELYHQVNALERLIDPPPQTAERLLFTLPGAMYDARPAARGLSALVEREGAGDCAPAPSGM